MVTGVLHEIRIDFLADMCLFARDVPEDVMRNHGPRRKAKMPQPQPQPQP